MKIPSEHVLVWAHKIHESMTLSSIIPSSLQACQKWRETWVDFPGLIKFNREDNEEVLFWFLVGGSMFSLNIELSVFSDTHVLVFTFSSAITLSFLLLHLSFMRGESDHISYMTYNSSCPICKVKSCLGSSPCHAHVQGLNPVSNLYPNSIIVVSISTYVSLPLPSS